MPSIKTTVAFGTTMTTQMMMPNAFAVGNNMYYSADELKEFCPKFFVGTSKTIRVIIERKKIPEYDYIYAIKGAEWNIMDATSKKAKLLISKNWVDTSFKVEEPKVKVVKAKVVKATVIPPPVVVPVVDVIPQVVVPVVDVNSEEDSDIEEGGGIVEEAPPIFELNEEDKFKDVDGNVLEIETRGEREVDKIYFSVKDVSVAFGILKLKDTLIRKDRGYERNVDYKLFNLKGAVNDGQQKTTNKKRLYLTYQGLLRMLFVSRNANANVFTKWATTKLFVLQMGSQIQKEDLVSNVLGVSARVIREVFNTDTHSLPCIYLFTLGTVKDLRVSMKIDERYNDGDVVAKYGFTKDLSRRTGEHIAKYNKIGGVNLRLKYKSYIDPQYLSKAEGYVKSLMDKLKLVLQDYNNETELVIIPNSVNELVEHHYDMIGKKYMGHVSELITKIKELEDKYEMILLTHQIEIQKKDAEMKDKVIELKDKDAEIIREKHEKEILQLKLELQLSRQ